MPQRRRRPPGCKEHRPHAGARRPAGSPCAPKTTRKGAGSRHNARGGPPTALRPAGSGACRMNSKRGPTRIRPGAGTRLRRGMALVAAPSAPRPCPPTAPASHSSLCARLSIRLRCAMAAAAPAPTPAPTTARRSAAHASPPASPASEARRGSPRPMPAVAGAEPPSDATRPRAHNAQSPIGEAASVRRLRRRRPSARGSAGLTAPPLRPVGGPRRPPLPKMAAPGRWRLPHLLAGKPSAASRRAQAPPAARPRVQRGRLSIAVGLSASTRVAATDCSTAKPAARPCNPSGRT